MAFRKGKKSFKGKSKRSKVTNRKKRSQKVTVQRSNLVQSDAAFVKLPYFDSYAFSSSYNPSAQLWRANSLFDPDQSGVGHQPLGFDQYSAFYANYQVNGFSITLDIRNDAAVSIKGVLCFSDTDSSSNNVSQCSEMKYAYPFTIGPLTGQNNYRIKKFISMRKLHGLRRTENEENLQAAVGSNPADPGYCWVKFESMDGATNVKVFCIARIKYYARMFGPLNPAQS